MHPGKRVFLSQLRIELDREHFEERAAILEFCAGMPRAEAERLAREAVRVRPMVIEDNARVIEDNARTSPQ